MQGGLWPTQGKSLTELRNERAEHLDDSEKEEGAQPWSSHPNSSYSIPMMRYPASSNPSERASLPTVRSYRCWPPYLSGFCSSQTALKTPNMDTRCGPGLSSWSLLQGILPLPSPQPLTDHQFHIWPLLPLNSVFFSYADLCLLNQLVAKASPVIPTSLCYPFPHDLCS